MVNGVLNYFSNEVRYFHENWVCTNSRHNMADFIAVYNTVRTISEAYAP